MTSTTAGRSARPTPVTGHHARPPPAATAENPRRRPDDPARSGRGSPLPLITSRPPHPGGLPPDRPAPVRAGTRTAQILSAPFPSTPATDDLAENVAETLTKGSRAIVTGRLKQRSY